MNLGYEDHHGQRQQVEHVRFVKRGRWHEHKAHQARHHKGIRDDQPHGGGVGALLLDVLDGVKGVDAQISPGAVFLLLSGIRVAALAALLLGLGCGHRRPKVHHTGWQASQR